MVVVEVVVVVLEESECGDGSWSSLAHGKKQSQFGMIEVVGKRRGVWGWMESAGEAVVRWKCKHIWEQHGRVIYPADIRKT